MSTVFWVGGVCSGFIPEVACIGLSIFRPKIVNFVFLGEMSQALDRQFVSTFPILLNSPMIVPSDFLLSDVRGQQY